MSFRITELWAFVAVGDDDEDGVIAFLSEAGWMPMVMADKARLDSIRWKAEEVAKTSGKTVRLVHFSNRQDVETLGEKS